MWALVAGLPVLGPGPLEGQGIPPEVAAAIRDHDARQPERRKEARIAGVEELAMHSDDWRVSYWATYLARFSVTDSTNVGPWAERALTALSRLLVHKDTLDGRSRSHVEALESLVYDLVAFAMRTRGDTVGETRRAYESLRDERLQDALASDPANPVALVIAGLSLIVDGRREGDRRALLAGCSLQARGLDALPVEGLGAQPDFLVRWARQGRLRVVEALGPEGEAPCRQGDSSRESER